MSNESNGVGHEWKDKNFDNEEYCETLSEVSINTNERQ